MASPIKSKSKSKNTELGKRKREAVEEPEEEILKSIDVDVDYGRDSGSRTQAKVDGRSKSGASPSKKRLKTQASSPSKAGPSAPLLVPNAPKVKAKVNGKPKGSSLLAKAKEDRREHYPSILFSTSFNSSMRLTSPGLSFSVSLTTFIIQSSWHIYTRFPNPL